MFIAGIQQKWLLVFCRCSFAKRQKAKAGNKTPAGMPPVGALTWSATHQTIATAHKPEFNQPGNHQAGTYVVAWSIFLNHRGHRGPQRKTFACRCAKIYIFGFAQWRQHHVLACEWIRTYNFLLFLFAFICVHLWTICFFFLTPATREFFTRLKYGHLEAP